MNETQDRQSETPRRRPRSFVPGADQGLNRTPEAVSGGPATDTTAYADLQLGTRPLRGLKLFGWLLLVYLLLVLGLDGYDLLQRAWNAHPALGGGLSLLLLLLLGAGLRLLVSAFWGRESFRQVRVLQGGAERLRAAGGQRHAATWLQQLSRFYRDKPQQPALQQALDALPDYADDRETVVHLERRFLAELDRQAYRQISKYSAHAGLAVGISLWPALDMALTLWRNARLVEAVSKTYGVRPSLNNRLRILAFVLKNMAFAGASQMASDYVTTQGASSVLPKAAGAIGQGLGVGLISVRIGLLTMRACRPVPFAKGEQRRLPGFVREIGEALLASRKGGE